LVLVGTTEVDGVLGGAAMELKGNEGRVQLGVPGTRSLTKPVQYLHQSEHLVTLILDLEVRRLLDVDFLL
jgi:hypothetical protein